MQGLACWMLQVGAGAELQLGTKPLDENKSDMQLRQHAEPVATQTGITYCLLCCCALCCYCDCTLCACRWCRRHDV
jgi:hypothetical protein